MKHRKNVAPPGNGSSDAKAYLAEVMDRVKTLKPPNPENLTGVPSSIREVLLYPDPRLKNKAVPVEVFDDDLRKLVADMAQTMYSSKIGVGLSAPQVGDNRRVIIVDIFNKMTEEQKREATQKKIPQSQLLIAVNPEVWPVPGPPSREIEGCLSLPGIYGHVTRPTKAILKGLSLRGEPFALMVGSALGRAVLHEIDHLDGLLLLDRFDPMTRRVALKDLAKTRTRPRPSLPVAQKS